jgi:hypothetical protein
MNAIDSVAIVPSGNSSTYSRRWTRRNGRRSLARPILLRAKLMMLASCRKDPGELYRCAVRQSKKIANFVYMAQPLERQAWHFRLNLIPSVPADDRPRPFTVTRRRAARRAGPEAWRPAVRPGPRPRPRAGA